ncbi:MAG: hypothetical protein K6A41_10295 [Bacteroidales bacterium]|nr:hypothetical protein [Bacteroidales bacterium]
MQFKDVIVRQELKDQLVRQIREGRISHAQLFTCQPGNDGFALAVAMAQYMCCEHPTETDSCGECPSCKQISKLEYPDLHIYFPTCGTKSVKSMDCESALFMNDFRKYVKSNNFHIDLTDWVAILDGENKQPAINIRDCAQILNQNSIRSYQGGYKIYILWCADRLRHDAAPKLLKTLEEPEEKSLFILITDKPDQMLNTILSRTQAVKFPRLSEEQIEEALMKEFPDLTPEVAQRLAIHADHNYIKARKSYPSDELSDEMLADFREFMQSAIFYAQRQPLERVNYQGINELIEKIASKSREVQKQYFQFWQELARKFLVAKADNGTIIKMTDEERQVYDLLRGAFSVKFVTDLNKAFDTAILHVARNSNTSLLLTDLYFRIVDFLTPKRK